MLFEEIPTDFKNTMVTYLKNLFSNIQKKDNNVVLSNNLLYPANIRTDHLKMEVGCSKHIEVMTELFFLLDIFHNYSKQKQFFYSITAGSLLGYYKIGSVLPWDDDIDIVVPFSQFRHVEDLWKDTPNKAKKIWDKNWTYKNIKINEYDIILLKLNNANFFKLKLNSNSIVKRNQYQSDIGGLDILSPDEFRQTLSTNLKTTILDTKENYYTGLFCNVETSLLKQNTAELQLNQMYPRWKEMKHPNLF
tara:strand:+ start:10452 stop:11195 length:744 start_codon:yes stop_codon:yes gene_type:complete